MTSMTDPSTLALGELITALGADRNLDRERAAQNFQLRCTNEGLEDTLTGPLVQAILKMMDAESWEQRFGGVKAAQIIFMADNTARKAKKDDFKTSISFEDDSLAGSLLARSDKLMEDSQFRVRKALGPAIGALARIDGALLLKKMRAPLLANISANLERSDSKQENPGSTRYSHEAKAELMHDTEGWRSLDTSVGSLAELMRSAAVSSPIEALSATDEELVKLIQLLAKHTNRFVREITFHLIEAVMSGATTAQVVEQAKSEELLDKEKVSRLVKIVSEGLADNWSQVRMSASRAVRAYFALYQKISKLQIEKSEHAHTLLPRLCLNRRYVAEGVRVHCNDTWRNVTKGRGKDIVTYLATYFVEYYALQSGADNHAVREAACHCISELCEEVCKGEAKAIFEEHVDKLLGALIDCFKDASWPVRDSACIACAQFVKAFPKESESRIQELWKLWKEHLSDNIRSVREHSAQSLMQVAAVLGEEKRIVQYIDEMLPKYHEQAPDSKKFSNLETATKFGVAAPSEESKHDHSHDHGSEGEKAHENQQMYSCGSLAPKLKRGGGCMDHGFSRKKEPWEETEGAVFLIRELSLTNFPAIEKYFQTLELLCTLDTFKHAKELRETVFRALSGIVKGLPRQKKIPKNSTLSAEETAKIKTRMLWRGQFSSLYLENFLEPTFRSIKKGPQLVQFAAMEFLQALNMIYGYVMKATLERNNPEWAEEFDRSLKTLANIPQTEVVAKDLFI